MKKREEYKKTTNRYVYNRRRKEQLAGCSYCGWHRGENDRRKCYQHWTTDKYDYEKVILSDKYNPDSYDGYGVTWEWKKTFNRTIVYHKFPNWKLVSKNKKQWEHKNKLRKVYSSLNNPDYFRYKW
jgi:hypothetical protein